MAFCVRRLPGTVIEVGPFPGEPAVVRTDDGRITDFERHAFVYIERVDENTNLPLRASRSTTSAAEEHNTIARMLIDAGGDHSFF